MEQKRFLTADEVFQLFGVDADGLEGLVNSGAVKALPDLGKFKYRSEDFLSLVKAGKLTPRTSAEMFQVDSKGDIPFLKVKDDDQGVKFDEDVMFLELDEDALEEQAVQKHPTPKTPEVSDDWFAETFGPSDTPKKTSDESNVIEDDSIFLDEKTDFDLNTAPPKALTPKSDSNVQILGDDDIIDFAEPDVEPSVTDSDVRLEGPVSSLGITSAIFRKKHGSDSDVRLAKPVAGKPVSDSDVTIASPSPLVSASAAAPSQISMPQAKKRDSDSDVQLVEPIELAEDVSDEIPVEIIETADSESDVVLVNAGDSDTNVANVVAKSPSPPDSDSDVQIAPATAAELDEVVATAIPVGKPQTSDRDSDVVLYAQPVNSPVVEKSELHESPTMPELMVDAPANSADSDIRLEADWELPSEVTDASMEIEIPEVVAEDDSGISLDFAEPDSGIALGSVEANLDVANVTGKTDDEIVVAEDDSGISLESADADSGISVEPTNSDSGISLQSAKTDSDIVLDPFQTDSGIALGPAGAESGISLDFASADSGITVDGADSGIRFEPSGDSGITLMGGDSGITFEDDVADAGATMVDGQGTDFESANEDGQHTQSLGLSEEFPQDSGFDVSLAEHDKTTEMVFAEDDEEPPVAVPKARSKGAAPAKAMSLSEAFKLDEPIEVQDLDISEDLDEAGDDEFAEIEEDVLEASDADFSAAEISVAEEEQESDSYVPAAKVRAVPKEPAWGLAALIPIGGATLAMALTIMALWGGIATMWSGEPAPEPAGSVISALAGLIPS